MSVTTQRNVIYAIAFGLLIASGVVVAWSFSTLESGSTAERDNDRTSEKGSIPTVAAGMELDESKIARNFRGPLYDPPPAPTRAPEPVQRQTPPPKPTRPSLEWTLVGTIIDSSESLAILADASGNFDVKAAGESLELTPAGITLTRIEAESVTLDWRGQTQTVTLDRDNKTSPANRNRGNNRRNRNRP
ncbi:MAG: hypothetical protein AAGG48_03250 [Planctomycetota bacterium]